MSKFNNEAVSMKTVNHEGQAAYKMDLRSELMTQVLTSFFNEKKFYGDNSEEMTDILKTLIPEDPAFVAKLAIFARNEFNMRSVSHVLLGYLANIPEGKPYVRKTLKRIVHRGDDATEILAFYLNTFGKPIPNSLRRGLRDVFSGFDAYTLGKYKGIGNQVTMKDILCLTRPAPKDEEQSKNWKDLLEGTLQTPYTWETEISSKGNTREVWEELIDSEKVGYMALLRNFRNILNADPENIQKVFDEIADPEAVRKAKQLPFRYLSAYRNLPALWNWREAEEALERAADISVENLPKIPGRTVIAIDVSGSMRHTISQKSTVRCSDISCLLGVIADHICEKSIVYTFDNKLYDVHIPKRNGIISSALSIPQNGGGTYLRLPFEKMIQDHIGADRIIVLSDNECYSDVMYGDNRRFWGFDESKTMQSLADEYRQKVNPNFWVHAVDLQGYGTQQFIGSKFNLVCGWSEKLFEFITLAENGTDSLMKRIQSIKV